LPRSLNRDYWRGDVKENEFGSRGRRIKIKRCDYQQRYEQIAARMLGSNQSSFVVRKSSLDVSKKQ
jgi:hypothetical protein